MRSSVLIAFGLLATFAPVSAIFRPGGYYGGGHRPPPPYGGGHSDDCKTSSAPTTPTTPPTTTPTPTTPPKKCPTGFHHFNRTASALNSQTSEWCMKVVTSPTAIKIQDGAAFCKTANAAAVPTMFENANEKETLSADFGSWLATQSPPPPLGAFGTDGRRVPQCISRDQGVLQGPDCGRTKSFVLNDPHTDPTYAWTIWAPTEPSANFWSPDIEECIQYAIDGTSPTRTNLLNDIYCNRVVAPNDPEWPVYWNYGMLCGMAPQ